MSQRLAEYQMRLQYLESMYRERQEDVVVLSQYLSSSSSAGGGGAASSSGAAAAAVMAGGTNTGSGVGTASTSNEASPTNLTGPNISQSSIFELLSPETRALFRNASSSARMPSSLRLPTAYHFLPHLLDDASSLRPAFQMSRGRQGVSIVLGVPTVKRDKQSYLLSTLDNMIRSMDEDEQNDTMIVVFIGETDTEYVQLVAKQIEVRFTTYVENGLIEVLSPPASYYPNMDKLRITLGDSPERVKWRSKQNLDYAFLMAYSQPKGTFYVQLEDDLLVKRNFITIMKKFAMNETQKKDPWFLLDFCQLGFIGK